MPQFVVRVKDVEDGLFKVTWAIGGLDCKPYFVSRDHIATVAKSLRNTLNQLVSNQHSRKSGAAEKSLLKLAENGRKLRRMLFQVDADARNDDENIEKISRSLESTTERAAICFVGGARVHIPWGLMYSGEVPKQISLCNPTSLPGFWCNRYRLSTVYQDAVSPFDFECIYPASQFETLMAADHALLEKIKPTLSPEETQILKIFEERFGPPAKSTDELGTHWLNKQKSLGLLHFYGHANNKSLALSKIDTLDLVDFEDSFKKGNSAPKCVVFLNGCYTASGDSQQRGFLEATGRPGFCGFVGAEAEVPDEFGLRFGIAFQKMLYEGNRLHDILDTLRQKHWPISLVYGLYAYPELRLDPIPGLKLPKLPEVNYSEPQPTTLAKRS